MKKNKFNFWIRISFISLFVLNVVVVIAALAMDGWWFLIAAILLSILQLMLLKNGGQITGPSLRSGGSEIKRPRLNPVLSKGLVKTNYKHSLTSKELNVISGRSNNSYHEVIPGSLHDPSDSRYVYLKGNSKPFVSGLKDLRVMIGNDQCAKPYDCSILNAHISENSDFSPESIRTISEGATIRNFAVNTGGVGISSHIIRGGGDLVWQVSLADCTFVDHYDGAEHKTKFKLNAARDYVKMIELVICAKETESKEREIKKAVTMVKNLRSISGGKPVGIRIINPDELSCRSVCRAMLVYCINVDFLTIESDVPEYTAGAINGKDLPLTLENALLNARNTIVNYGLPVKIIASGRFITEFDILKAIALGADLVFTSVPFKVASQPRPWYSKDRSFKQRIGVANFHSNTIEATLRLMELKGIPSLSEVSLNKFYVNHFLLKKTLADVYGREHADKQPWSLNLN